MIKDIVSCCLCTGPRGNIFVKTKILTEEFFSPCHNAVRGLDTSGANEISKQNVRTDLKLGIQICWLLGVQT